MATHYLTDATIFHDEWDLTGQANNVSFNTTRDIQESTVFGANSRSYLAGGLRAGAVSLGGFAGDGDIDADLADLDQTTAGIITVSQDGTENSVAYGTQVIEASYETFGSIGSIDPFSAEYTATGDLARGYLMHPKTARTTDGDSTGVQLGAWPATTETLYVGVHLFSITGGTLTVTVESDDNGSFTTATVVQTMTALTAVGSEWKTDTTGSADDYYRVSWDYDGTTCTFAAFVAIQ